jgi:hypothetical protein
VALIAALPVRVMFSISCREVDGDAGLDEIGAFTVRLNHAVAGIVDDIGIITTSADQRVCSGAAVQQVVSGKAEQRVIATAAGNGVVPAEGSCKKACPIISLGKGKKVSDGQVDFHRGE